MPFDFHQFLLAEAVPHVLGPAKNVRRDHVGLQCPFCGPLDPGMHFSYNLKTGKYGCWRDSTHRGKSAERLIMALKGITREKAKALILDGMATEEVSWEELADRAKSLWLPPIFAPRPRAVKFPDDFRPPAPTKFRRRFWQYLHRERGFRERDVEAVVDAYGFQCGLVGKHKDRLIIPVRVKGKLLGWTGRTVHRHVEPRYYAFPDGNAIKAGLPFYDVVAARKGGRVLVVCEGGLDAPKLDFYGKKAGVHALPLMGTSATPAQLSLLLDLAPSYDRLVVVLDQKAEASAMALASQLALVRPAVAFLPEAVKDPGALTPRKALDFAESLLKLAGKGWV